MLRAGRGLIPFNKGGVKPLELFKVEYMCATESAARASVNATKDNKEGRATENADRVANAASGQIPTRWKPPPVSGAIGGGFKGVEVHHGVRGVRRAR